MPEAKKSLNLRITGGKPLSGEVTINSAKNSAVALLAAALLNEGVTVLENMPRIEEVKRLLEVLTSIGVSAVWDKNTLTLTPPAVLNLKNLNVEAARRTRSALLFLGALASRGKTYHFPYPGGCQLGDRSVFPHLLGLRAVGLKISEEKGSYKITPSQLRGREIVLYETGDTVTENVLLAAARAPGVTTIKYASANYMVREVCYFLETLGVKIEGIGTSTLIVHGVKEIKKEARYRVAEDPIEAMLFIAIAAVTRSTLTIRRVPIEFLELELLKLKTMGLRYKQSKKYLSHNGFTALADLTLLPSRFTALADKIHPLPFPGLNIDNLPFFVPIATQAKGTTLIHDWVFENRAIYYLELNKLGANIRLADPHRVFIQGPTPLSAAEVICPPALRPAAIILIGMLAAKGESLLRNIYSINRGYEDLAERLRALGAEIEVVE
jgi:UDP-N-acetylglucosamine 1-carboxyvinyltransferase